jgi:hypothetical protein
MSFLSVEILYRNIWFKIYRDQYRVMNFVGSCLKLRKVTISFVISVRAPSEWNHSAPTGRILIKLNISIFFENLSRKFEFHSNRTRKWLLCKKTNIHFYHTSLSYS